MKRQGAAPTLIFLLGGSVQEPGQARKVSEKGFVGELEALFEGPGGDKDILSSAAALVQEQGTLGLDTEAASGDCFDFTCSQGWVPKIGHFNMSGTTDDECCVQTCELFKCTKPFIANSSYHGNVGTSEKECCDITCNAILCPYNQKIPAELLDKAALNTDECCRDTCAKVRCPRNSVPVPANQDKLYPEGQAHRFCCQQTCGSFTCDYHEGWVFNKAARELTNPTTEKCCLPTCKRYECPDGFAMPPSKTWLVKQNMECCDKQCKQHTCSAHWVHDHTKEELIGDTDQECCEMTCAIYKCNPGWVPNHAAANFIGVDDPTCCHAQCVQYQGNCTGNWAPDETKHEIVGANKELCCQKTCGLYSCTNESLVLIPRPHEHVHFNEDECCESKECEPFGKKTATDWRGCNSIIGEENCHSSYTVLHNNRTNATDILSCWWNPELEVCQLSDPEPTGCHGQEEMLPAAIKMTV
eukprot:gb/GFBE01043927.1/.p1 GENE.gb/GFBE01043927.1/~~gb/GFBE01043927.1/.p1  ORF type:complete len:470 (+),score=127.17 gb/GFBE01043927.1/:1-1410(+)